MSLEASREIQIRMKAFAWLKERAIGNEGVFHSSELNDFKVDGKRITLKGSRGIWQPKGWELPISITTAADGPYEDVVSDDGLILYKYQGTNAQQWDNVGLRKAMQQHVPLIYFHGISRVKGRHVAIWPVFIVGDDPASLTFTVAADDMSALDQATENGFAEENTGRRQYITATVRQRLHQRSFRIRVLDAYRERCSLCNLRHPELLDAAHIIPDGQPGGDPIVPNGLSLCKIHHAAFDRNFLGITPDYNIDVRADILKENDGPMLQHGLKELHEKKIILPRRKDDRPKPELLERRYAEYKQVG